MEGGYFKLGRFGGAPVRLHWSAPLGAFAFCGFSFVPGAWGAFLLLILMHELGHAFLVRRFGLYLVSVDVHGLGGLCQWSGTTTPTRRALLACSLLAHFRVCARAKTLSALSPKLELRLRKGRTKRLDVGICGDEFHSL